MGHQGMRKQSEAKNFRRKREGNGDLGYRKLSLWKRTGQSLRDEKAMYGDILKIKK